MKNRLSRMREKGIEELWAGISLMGALCFMLFLYAPLELYFYNQRDFWFDLYQLIPLLLVIFVAFFLISVAVMCILYFSCPKLYHIALPLATIVFLCTYIQGNFLLGELPIMDGREYDWADYSEGRLPSVILWIVVTCLVLTAVKWVSRDKFCKVVKLASIFMVLMLSLTAVSICITTKGYRNKLDAYCTVENDYEFSENENFIIFVIDAADSGTLYEMMEENPEYRELFADFTYFHNTLGAYPCTAGAIPQIIGGEWFENEIDFDQYRTDAYKNSPFLDELEQRGYKLGMYEDELPFLDESIYRFDNVKGQKSKVESYWRLAKLEIKLVGLRYAPFDLKRFCSFKLVEFATTQQANAEYTIFVPRKKVFYERMTHVDTTLTQEKCFKFIHIDGAHVPFAYDKDLNLIAGGSYEDAMEASLTITKAFLDKMKEAGVYDNSVIVVMADHGLDGYYNETYSGRQNPVLLVKGVGEHHEMMISEAPVSYGDLQEAFSRLLDGKCGSEIFDYREGDERERRYLFYEFEDEDHLYEYVTTGHASDDEAMTPTGKTYFRGK